MVKRLYLFVTLLSCITVFSVSAQEDYRSRIAIVPMENGTGLDQYNPLCSTITETVSLVLEFLKDYRVLDEQDANLARLEKLTAGDQDTVRAVAEEEGVDEIVYGRMEQVDDVFQFTISLYNVKKGRVTNTQTAEAFSVLDVFDAGDELTEGLISQLSDVRIAFGSIRLDQKGGKGNYTVNLDGFPLRNPDKKFKKVLNGQYEISITQERLTGREVVFKELINVLEEEETVVEFTIPPGSPEEFEWMEEQGAALLALGSEDESFDQFMEELTLFQNRTLALEYDRDLEGLRQNYLDEAGELATITLQNRMEEADKTFYDKRARFDDSLEQYEGISSLVKTEYEVKMLASSKDLYMSEPQKIQVGSNNQIYFDARDREGSDFLFAWNTDDDSVLYRKLNGGEGDHFQGDFSISGWRIYLWEPGATQVEILDNEMQTLDSLPIPDLPGGISGIKLALSQSRLVYLISPDQIRVIDTTRSYNEAGELMPPDRYYSIEEELGDVLNRETTAPGDVFFDEARHLNIFYPQSGNLYICDEKGNQLKKLNFPESQLQSRVAVDSTGFFYITLYEDNNIAKYTPAGEMITTYGRYGTNPGQFSLPVGIALNSEGIVYVADSYNARVQSLDPQTPPVIYPEIARYGTDLDRRIDRTQVAVRKDRAARGEVSWKTHTGNIVTTSALLASTFGLVILTDYFGNNAANAYYDYQTNTDPGGVEDARNKSNVNTAMQGITEIGGMITFSLAGAWATETMLKIGLDSTLTKYNRRQIQTLDMNDLYETDPDKYRSIRGTSRIGVWTGIVPPVLGILGMGAAAGMANESSAELTKYSVMGGLFIPPIFSHLHGGRFSMGLLIAGLSADLLGIWGLIESDMMINGELEPWGAEKYAIGNPDTVNMSRAFDRVGELKGFYLLGAAFGIRLAAGIFDTRYGWTYTNSYNRYKAVRPKEEAETASADFDVKPYLDDRGSLGLALNISF